MAGIASAVAVAVEVPHGPVVDVLLERGFIVHAINPKQLDRLRDRFSIAGAKDDRRDAYVSADGLRTDRHLFRRLQIADPRLIELRAWSRLAEELQEERVRLSDRFHQQLWRYYPEMLKLLMILPPLGFSSFGSRRLHRQKRRGYACQRWSGCSSSIAFAA
jgi:Transposase